MLDLKGHVEGLRRQLRALKFNQTVNYQGMVHGEPKAFVDFYRKLLCDFDAELTSKLVDEGFSLLGTTDFRFMEVVYRILRDLLNMRPPITLNQFHTNGFAERKLQMATSIACQLAFLINPTRMNRRVVRRSSGQRSLGKPDSDTCKILPDRTGMVRSSKQSISKVIPASKLVHNNVFSRMTATDGVHLFGNVNISDNTQNCASYERELEGSSLQNGYNHVSKEKLVTQPSTFESIDSCFIPIWTEESHNQAATGRNSGPLFKQSKGRKWGSPLVFSSTIPNAAQTNQSEERHSQRRLISSTFDTHVKHGNPNYSVVRNPHPSALNAQNIVPSKSTLLRDRASPTAICALSPTRRGKTTVEIRAPVTCLHGDSDISSQSGNDPPTEVQHDAMQEILLTLSKLNGKVDSLISRLGTLESRLSNKENGLINGHRVSNNLFKRGYYGSQDLTLRETCSQDVGYWNRASTAQSESSGCFGSILPPILLSPATTTMDQKLVCGKTNEPHNMIPSSRSSLYIPPQTAEQSRGQNRCDEHRPSEMVQSPLHDNKAVSMERKETVNRSPSLIRNLPCSSDTLKTPLSDLSKRSAWPSMSSAAQTHTIVSRPASLPPETREFPSDYNCSPHETKVSQHLISLPAPPKTDGLGLSFRQKLFERTSSSSFSTNANSLNCGPNPGTCDSSNFKNNTNPLEFNGTLTAEPYHAQVNRITSMLAETQGLLETQRSNLLNGTA